jgi:hypothetical protein
MKMFLRILSACILVLMLSSLSLPIFAEESDFVDEPQIETGYNRGYEGGKNGDGKLYAHGLDISVWQGDSFNFEAARAAGFSYIILRAGVTYEKDETAPGGLALTDAVLNSPDGRTFEQVLAEYVPWAGGANPSVASNEYFKGGETWPVCLEAVEGLRNYYPETVWAPFDRYYTTEESAEMASIKPEQEQYWKEWRGYFITGQKDINDDAVWAEYVKGYEGVQNPRYMEIYNKGYEAWQAENA